MNLGTFNYIIESAEPYYQNNEFTKYHTWEHAQEVMNAVIIITNKMNLSFAKTVPILIAAAWHDAIYIPGAKIGYNEELSAQLLIKKFENSPLQQYDKEIIRFAAELVRRTSIQYHKTDSDKLIHMEELLIEPLFILLDADLSSLGANYETFYDNQIKILLENNVNYTAVGAWKPTYDFLSTMRVNNGEPTFFRTAQAYDLWEDDAIANVKQWKIDGEHLDRVLTP